VHSSSLDEENHSLVLHFETGDRRTLAWQLDLKCLPHLTLQLKFLSEVQFVNALKVLPRSWRENKGKLNGKETQKHTNTNSLSPFEVSGCFNSSWKFYGLHRLICACYLLHISEAYGVSRYTHTNHVKYRVDC
jgi:hypothetical protein